MEEARRRVFEEMREARRFPDPWPNMTNNTHPFLNKDLVLPADELRAGFTSGISADPNIAIVDAINGIIEETRHIPNCMDDETFTKLE